MLSSTSLIIWNSSSSVGFCPIAATHRFRHIRAQSQRHHFASNTPFSVPTDHPACCLWLRNRQGASMNRRFRAPTPDMTQIPPPQPCIGSGIRAAGEPSGRTMLPPPCVPRVCAPRPHRAAVEPEVGRHDAARMTHLLAPAAAPKRRWFHSGPCRTPKMHPCTRQSPPGSTA